MKLPLNYVKKLFEIFMVLRLYNQKILKKHSLKRSSNQKLSSLFKISNLEIRLFRGPYLLFFTFFNENFKNVLSFMWKYEIFVLLVETNSKSVQDGIYHFKRVLAFLEVGCLILKFQGSSPSHGGFNPRRSEM